MSYTKYNVDYYFALEDSEQGFDEGDVKNDGGLISRIIDRKENKKEKNTTKRLENISDENKRVIRVGFRKGNFFGVYTIKGDESSVESESWFDEDDLKRLSMLKNTYDGDTGIDLLTERLFQESGFPVGTIVPVYKGQELFDNYEIINSYFDSMKMILERVKSVSSKMSNLIYK